MITRAIHRICPLPGKAKDSYMGELYSCPKEKPREKLINNHRKFVVHFKLNWREINEFRKAIYDLENHSQRWNKFFCCFIVEEMQICLDNIVHTNDVIHKHSGTTVDSKNSIVSMAHALFRVLDEGAA